MSALLGLLCPEILNWFSELEKEGVRITQGRTGTKLRDEAQEFYDEPSLEEGADVFISLLGACFSEGWTAHDLAVAVIAKMKINRTRTWIEQPDGTYQHG